MWLEPGQITIGDGAMGTMLQAAGLPAGGCPEWWNLERPEVVESIHRAYAEAGAQLVETNTFGGTRARLAHYGLQDQVHALNCAGARLARAGAGPGAIVAGAMGPTGALLEPMGELPVAEAVALYAEQAEGLAAGGVDCFLVETMFDPEEARAAITGIRQVSDLPIIAQATFTEHRRTMTGATPAAVAEMFQAWGAAVVGANCSLGPADLVPVIAEMAAAAQVPVSVFPNAGIPQLQNMRTVYPLDPESYAAWAVALVRAGASLIGGCCGTTPAHIRALRAALAEGEPNAFSGAPPGP